MRFNRWYALGLVFGLAACDDAGTNPEDQGPFDPTASAADLAVVQSAFESPVFQSLAKSGGGFSQFQGAPALASVLVDAGWDLATAARSWELHEAGERVAGALAASSAAVVLIPDDFRGRTYDYDPEEGYYYNQERTGAPATGMRFILYEVNPVTGEPGETEIGYADVLDESTDAAGIARLVVVSGDVEYLNYTVSASLNIGSITFAVSGFISDGTDQVDLDLSTAFTSTFATSSVDIDYIIAVPSRDFSLTADLVMEFNAESESEAITVDVQFRERTNSVQLQGSFSDGESDAGETGGSQESGQLEVLVNGALFATIAINGDQFTVLGPNGEALSAGEASALRDMMDSFENVFDDTFEDFVRPVSWLFQFD